MKLKFKTWDCELKMSRYTENDRIALRLDDVNNGSPIATVTVNLPDEKLECDEVFIKDYSKNEGMLDTLLDNGVIEQPIGWVQSGHTNIPKCKLTPHLLAGV